MKRKDLLITIGTLAYSILFYKQMAGINFMLFNLILIGLVIWKKPALLRKPHWLLIAGSAFFTSFCIVWQGTTLAVISNVIALVLLGASSINPDASVIFNAFFSFYSIAGSFIFIILRLVDPAFREKRDGTEIKDNKSFSWKKFLTFFLPLLVIILFFCIYRAANPLFKKFTSEINLDFISFPWIGFAFLGFLLLCGFFYQYRIKALDKWEENKPRRLGFYENQKKLKWINEKNAALFLFGTLNLMLVFINAVDLNYLYLGSGMPKEITHAAFVHDGVGMLILSILIAISLVLFFFRGNMNFEKDAKLVRIMVYLWIAQNIMMVISTILRNNMYVEEYNLTYKRIGVYIYLLLSLSGLVTTFYKIYDKRTNWFLFRSNSLAAVMLLFVSAAIDFDLLISDYNIRHAKSIAALDKSYLVALSETNIPQLYALKKDPGFVTASAYHYNRFYNLVDEPGFYYNENRKNLDKKLLSFLEENKGYGWRSWNRRREKICKEIQRLDKEGTIDSLDYSSSRINDLAALAPIKKLKSLNMASTFYYKWSDLENFPELQSLDIQNCGINSLDSFPALTNLKELNITGNNIYSFEKLNRFPALEKLAIVNYTSVELNDFPVLPKLRELNLRFANVRNLEVLKNMPALSKLDFTGGRCDKSLPFLPQLRSLNFSGYKYTFKDSLIKTLLSVPNLEELFLSETDLREISFFYRNNSDKSFTSIFTNLKRLDISSNSIVFAEKLYLFGQLEELDISKNKLYYVPSLNSLMHLVKLNISSNFFSNISELAPMNWLKELDLSNNTAIKDFAALKNMRDLKTLNISSTLFSDLSLLYEMKNLVYLNLTGSYVRNLNGIERIISLKEISVDKLTEADVNNLSKLRNLKAVIVTAIHPEVKLKIEKLMPGIKLETQQISESSPR